MASPAWHPARAAVGDGEGRVSIQTAAVPEPERNEVLVAVKAAGVCRTDLDALRWPGPLILGHEGSGVVEAVGPEVEIARPGQPVVLNWAIPCGACAQCRRGAAYLCATHAALCGGAEGAPPRPAKTLIGGAPAERMFELGAFSELALVDAAAVTPIPDSVGFPAAAITGCAVMTGAGSVFNVAHVRAGASVAVVGCGGVGLNALQAARIRGAHPVIAVDRDRAALDKTARFGATHAVLASEADTDLVQAAREVRALTGGEGVDHLFESTGRRDLAFQVLRLVRSGGHAVLMSGFEAGDACEVPLDLLLWNKRLEVALYGGCVPDRDFPRLFTLHRQGAFKLDEQIDQQLSLDDLPEAFKALTAGRGGKCVVRF